MRARLAYPLFKLGCGLDWLSERVHAAYLRLAG